LITRCGDIDVAWYEVGRGAPLILVHGLADDHRAWREVLPPLMLEHRVILYDFRGHGQTSLGRPDGTLAQLAGDLRAVLDALRLERVALAGFSLGGTIVMRFAIDLPERVGRLIPIATSSRVGRAAAEWYGERAQLAGQGQAALLPELEKDTQEQFATAPALAAAHMLIRRESTADPRGYANACRAMAALREMPLDGELGRIKAPTLVIAAADDHLCPPKAADIIAAGIAGSRVAVVKESGHQLPVQQPAALAKLMLEFLNSPIDTPTEAI
jgi:pimeloyl-ACP methyl ester carboxylesterase